MPTHSAVAEEPSLSPYLRELRDPRLNLLVAMEKELGQIPNPLLQRQVDCSRTWGLGFLFALSCENKDYQIICSNAFCMDMGGGEKMELKEKANFPKSMQLFHNTYFP